MVAPEVAEDILRLFPSSFIRTDGAEVTVKPIPLVDGRNTWYI